MSARWAGGSSPQWKRVRAVVLARDGHRCKMQLDGCTTLATEVHHVAPREIHGDDPTYLVAACRGCNVRYGAPEGHDPAVQRPAWLT